MTIPTCFETLPLERMHCFSKQGGLRPPMVIHHTLWPLNIVVIAFRPTEVWSMKNGIDPATMCLAMTP